MNKRKVITSLLSVAIGVVFLFSAWTKTQPIQYFEFILTDQLHLSHALARVAARFFIGLEAGIGLLLVCCIPGVRRWVPKLALALLVLFSAHLVYLLLVQGNDVNCGCMGSVAPMSPALSLLKNLGMGIGLGCLLRYQPQSDTRLLQIVTLPFALLITLVPFIVFPASAPVQLPLSKMYAAENAEKPAMELRQGKHVFCLISLSCTHCRDAASKISAMKRENPELPFYFAIAAGSDSTRAERYADFLNETNADNIPHHFVPSLEFVQMVQASGSDGVPVILWLQDSTILRKVTPTELNRKEIENWLK
jgi:hypothetical protein